MDLKIQEKAIFCNVGERNMHPHFSEVAARLCFVQANEAAIFKPYLTATGHELILLPSSRLWGCRNVGCNDIFATPRRFSVKKCVGKRQRLNIAALPRNPSITIRAEA